MFYSAVKTRFHLAITATKVKFITVSLTHK
jgi:hypothetical protein